MSRTKQSIKNIVSGIGSQIILALLSLFTTKIIKAHLGFEYLGLNGVFSNIISFLNLTELGIGSAIIFALYRPLAEKNENQILSLMQFYKKAYHIIALIVLLIGLLLIPFLSIIVKSSLDNLYVILVFLLFLTNTVSSYFLSYKQSLISADQKNYIITFYSLIFQIVTKFMQLLVVLLFDSYVLFLFIGIISTLLLNILLAVKANKLYPYLKTKKKQALTVETSKLILNKTKAMFLHSIGTFVNSGTDNIIISSFLGVVQVGKYGVYISIINIVLAVLNQFFNGIYSSLGNFIVEKNADEQYLLYKKIDRINSCAQIFIPVCLCMLFNPFIAWWLGEDACLSNFTVYLLSFNTFITIMRKPIHIFKSTSGLFEKDRFVPLVESIINICISILLVKFIGIDGVILGTIISCLLAPVWISPLIVYKYLFNKNLFLYFISHILNLIISVILVLILSVVLKFVTVTNIFLQLCLDFIIVCFVSAISVFCIYGRNVIRIIKEKINN